jgi:hypothetical protein
MSECINVTVREGDSFDELYLNYEKPWGTPHDFANSVLVANIKERFSESDALDSFGIVRLPTTGQIKLSLTARQTERLARIIELGYAERDISTAVVSRFGDPGVTIAEFPDSVFSFLWDLKEFWYQDAGTINTIVAGADLDNTPEGTLLPLVINTTTPHGLTTEDSIRISGTSVEGYNGVYANNQLAILSPTQFYIVPLAGIPQWSSNATGGTVQVLKQDTVCIGTLKVIPRISQQ